MATQTIFFEKRLLVLLFRLYCALDFASKAVCDLELDAAGILAACNICGKAGLPVKEVTCIKSSMTSGAAQIEELINRELVVRFRHEKDRRALAIITTDKGRERLEMLDRILSIATIWLGSNISEASFQQLVDKMHAFDAALKERHCKTFIPPSMILFLSESRKCLIDTSARYGITSLQAIILLMLNSNGTANSFNDIVQKLSVPPETIQFQIEVLATHGFLLDEGDLFITETGKTRQNMLLRQYSSLQQELLSSYPAQSFKPLRELIDTLLYLFT